MRTNSTPIAGATRRHLESTAGVAHDVSRSSAGQMRTAGLTRLSDCTRASDLSSCLLSQRDLNPCLHLERLSRVGSVSCGRGGMGPMTCGFSSSSILVASPRFSLSCGIFTGYGARRGYNHLFCPSSAIPNRGGCEGGPWRDGLLLGAEPRSGRLRRPDGYRADVHCESSITMSG